MKYIFDIKSFSFSHAEKFFRPVFGVIVVLFTSFVLAVAASFILPSIYLTPQEKALVEANAGMKALYEELTAGEKQLEDALTGLQQKDAAIFQSVFNSAAPNEDPVGKLDFLFGSDTIPDRRLLSYTRNKADELLSRSMEVDGKFGDIFAIVNRPGFVAPPMSLPLDDISYPQIGAGEGNKINPFLKTELHHRGLDIIVPQGEPVYSAAGGTVIQAGNNPKGRGKTVTILHGGGYSTSYAHLSEILVMKGQRVSLGQRIGSAGMSGNALAPHLHYEVMKDSVYCDPVNFFFASVSPEEYANMLFMSANTLQSMD